MGRFAAFVACCCVLTAPWPRALSVFQRSTAEGNLAIGRSIDANSTCGQLAAQSYCTVEGVRDICDASDPSKAHNASLLNDGGDGAGKSWWQSKGGEAAVTLELRLEQLARFAAFSVSFKSPRPAAAVLEKSADFGRVYVPYQYYSGNCSEFGLVDTGSAASVPGQLSCTSVYSDGENGMISYNVSALSGPQDWFYATNVRLRMLQFDDTVLTLPAGDQFYAAYEMVVVGSCVCHGHATTCVQPDQSQDSATLPLQCQCLNNTAGDNCERCLPGYYRDDPSNLEQPCKACQCSADGSQSIQCDPSPSSSTRQCPCRLGYTGTRCDQCTSGYFRSTGSQCLPCNCDPDGTASCDLGTGTCLCHPGVSGERCDRCPPNHLGPDRHVVGRCLRCYCNGYSNNCTPGAGWVQAEVTSTFGSTGEEDVVMVGWRSVGGAISNDTSSYLEVVASQGAKTVTLEFPKPYLGDKRTAYGQQLELNISLPKADMGKTYTVSLEIVGSISRYSVVQLNSSLVLAYPLSQSFKVTLLPGSFSVFQRLGYFKASEDDLREALANVVSLKLSFPASVSTLQLTGTRLPYASRPSLLSPLDNSKGVRYVENCTSFCPPRRAGEHCESCTGGYTVDPAYGGEFARCVPCYCSFKSGRCDPVSGVCYECSNNTAGDQCQYCFPGYTRQFWYQQCDRCDGGYWEMKKGVCAACGCHVNGSLTALCDTKTGACSCREGVTGPKCDVCQSSTTSGLFPSCRLCGECTSGPQTLVIDPIRREVDSLLRGALASGVYSYGGLESGLAEELRRSLDLIEAILENNSLDVYLLMWMVNATHESLSNRTTQLRLLFGEGAGLQSRLIALERASADVLEQTRVLAGRSDRLAAEYGALRNASRALLASTVDYAPLLRLARNASAASERSQRLIDSNVTVALSDAAGLLLSSAGELLRVGFEDAAQRLLGKLLNSSLELYSVEDFLASASLGLCGANTTLADCSRLCGGNTPSCNGSLYTLALGALRASGEAWSVAWATWRGLEEAVQGFSSISVEVGKVNASSLVAMDTLQRTSSGFVGLLARLRALIATVEEELGRSRENVGAVIQLENATLMERLPIDQSGLLRLLLRINASVSDILAVNISLANQSLLLTAANNALTASISARDLATQVLSSAATIQSRLAAVAVSLHNAYLIAAKTSKLVSAVTMETDQTNATLRSVGVVLDRTAVTIANLTLTLADLKAKFAQNANRLDQVNNATLSMQQLSRQLLTKALPTVQADADLVKDEANRVLVQSESDLLTSRNLRKRADGLATLTQNQLLVLESYQLTKERLQQRQLDIQDDTRRLANQIGVLSDQLHKLVAKNTACLDKDQLV